MTNKVKAAPEEAAANHKCHHWIIESANGPTSRGVCKLCGVEKEFDNLSPDRWVEDDISAYFELPGLPDIELDSDDDDS